MVESTRSSPGADRAVVLNLDPHVDVNLQGVAGIKECHRHREERAASDWHASTLYSTACEGTGMHRAPSVSHRSGARRQATSVCWHVRSLVGACLSGCGTSRRRWLQQLNAISN